MQRSPRSRFFAYALILTLVGSLFTLVLPASQPSYASHENITVNVSGDAVTETYEPGDSVAVEGVIDELVEGEDVTIRFKDPGGSTEDTVSFGEPGSSGNFDGVFESPNNAEEGLWTVEVDYDDEKAYTYFIIDDDADTILVVVDETTGIYQAADEVTISGEVDTTDPAEEVVSIVVLDPANGEIVDENDVELDGDEFEFSFDLESDAGHGRYAVLVTYDVDNQEGAALFEIEDEDEGTQEEEEEPIDTVTSDTDGDLSAEIDDDTYEQGGTVVITGEIDNYDSGDNEDLVISVEDPEGSEIFKEDEADVESNGDFTFEYDVDEDADTGAFTIIITYDNDEVELVLEVEEAPDTGEGDGGATTGVTSGDLTARLNKASYLAGEIVTVSGSVDELKEDDDENPEAVFILPYMPSGQVLLSASENVEPDEDGDFSATIVLDSDLEVDEDYWITVTYVDDEVELFFDITGVSSNPSDEITVETDEDEYSIGQTVEISGNVPPAILSDDQQLLIRINTPDDNPCRFDPIDIPSSGSFSYELVLGGECGMAGEYEVQVTYGEEEGTATFELIGSSASSYSLNVEGDSYPIEYELSGGIINSMFVRPAEDKLVITLDAEDDGQLTVELPRNVIDAVEGGEDVEYVVTIEDGSGNIVTIEVEESENTDSARTLVIDYPAGAERIEIAGTQVVPEFGAIAAIVMAVAIFGIIAATARFGKFSLFRQ